MSMTEAARLAALEAYDVLDTPVEAAFDRLTKLASDLFDAPIALVSLIDSERQWFKSRYGIDVSETPRSLAFCAHTIQLQQGDSLVVEDATRDPRFEDNPLVTGPAHIRFYAGAPLTTPDGHNLGSLCVIDTKPRPSPSSKDLARLHTLAQIVVDELELRRANRIAAQKQRLLELAESMSSVGSWSYRVATRTVAWSDEVYRIHGVTRSSFDPNLEDSLRFFHDEDRPKVRAHFAAAIADKTGYEFQLRLIRPDGEQREVIAKATCELDERGDVVSVFGVFQDVTDIIRLVRQAERSEARYRQLANTAPDMISESRLDGTMTYVSPAALAITGYTPDELVGQSAFSLMHADDAAEMHRMCRAVFDSKGAVAPWPVEFRATHKQGHQIWLESKPTPVIDPATGLVSGLVDVIRDITKHKALEAELLQARKDAEAAAAVKGEFLANMSHELRTPMTAVLGFAKLVSEQPELSDETRLFVDRLSTAGKALLATVNDILDFSKLEAGQVEIRPVPTAPTALLQETVDLFGQMAAAKNIRIALEARDLPADLRLDPDRIRQVLLNLVGNAVKFTDRGEVRIQASYALASDTLTVRVRDTGPGIPPDRMDALFQRFSQVDGSSTRRHGGTGLGLAICNGLIAAMHGQIGVESTPGQGSCFWFSLPAPQMAAAASLPQAKASARSLIDGCRILLADDNGLNRKLVAAYLAPLKVDLTEAVNGADAVARAASHPFDVILMDLRMPILDGAGAAEQIRASSGPNTETPILAFSADTAPALQDGLFDAVVAKPITARALTEAIQAAIAGETQMARHGSV